jgi:hypothetical protein
MRPHVLKILFQMPGNGNVIPEHREYVYKPKHLELDRRIIHGPVHEAVFPPAGLKNRGRAGSSSGKKVRADFQRAPFETFVGDKSAGLRAAFLAIERFPEGSGPRDLSVWGCWNDVQFGFRWRILRRSAGNGERWDWEFSTQSPGKTRSIVTFIPECRVSDQSIAWIARVMMEQSERSGSVGSKHRPVYYCIDP